MGPIAFDAARLSQVVRRPLDRDMLLYLVVSTVDVVLTYILLHGDGPWVIVESNPVANFFLATVGFWGMVVYKAFLVGLVIFNCHWIARSRPQTALKVIRFAQLAVTVVVAYSMFLLWNYA